MYSDSSITTPDQSPHNTPAPADFKTIKLFIDQLPEIIPGSAKTYSKTEVERTISDILYGGRSLAILTNTFGIHDTVHAYMRERVHAAWTARPEYKDARFHPMTGREFGSFEDTFRFADFILRTSELKPHNQQLAVQGLEHATQLECQNLYMDIFDHAHGMARRSNHQTHLYYENHFIQSNYRANKHLKTDTSLDHIDYLTSDLVAAQLSQDLYRVNDIVGQADAYLEAGGIEDLAREYKFHITPPPSLLPLYIDRVLQAIQHDPLLRDSVIACKINTLPNERNENGQLIPDIVLYPRRAQTVQTARASAVIFLERIKSHLADLDSVASFVGTPRFNTQITNTLAAAQSGGDVKNQLHQMGLLDKYFSADTNYAFVRSG